MTIAQTSVLLALLAVSSLAMGSPQDPAVAAMISEWQRMQSALQAESNNFNYQRFGRTLLEVKTNSDALAAPEVIDYQFHLIETLGRSPGQSHQMFIYFPFQVLTYAFEQASETQRAVLVERATALAEAAFESGSPPVHLIDSLGLWIASHYVPGQGTSRSAKLLIRALSDENEFIRHGAYSGLNDRIHAEPFKSRIEAFSPELFEMMKVLGLRVEIENSAREFHRNVSGLDLSARLQIASVLKRAFLSEDAIALHSALDLFEELLIVSMPGLVDASLISDFRQMGRRERVRLDKSVMDRYRAIQRRIGGGDIVISKSLVDEFSDQMVLEHQELTRDIRSGKADLGSVWVWLQIQMAIEAIVPGRHAFSTAEEVLSILEAVADRDAGRLSLISEKRQDQLQGAVHSRPDDLVLQSRWSKLKTLIVKSRCEGSMDPQTLRTGVIIPGK